MGSARELSVSHFRRRTFAAATFPAQLSPPHFPGATFPPQLSRRNFSSTGSSQSTFPKIA